MLALGCDIHRCHLPSAGIWMNFVYPLKSCWIGVCSNSRYICAGGGAVGYSRHRTDVANTETDVAYTEQT